MLARAGSVLSVIKLHLLFQCNTARELWSLLGLDLLIENAALDDRAGSAVLEALLRRSDNSMPGFENIGLKETIIVACWYLWWIRRRRTHDESVPPMLHCRMSVLTITANAAKALKKQSGIQPKWQRPECRKVKVNVDASFHLDVCAGSAGAVLRDQDGRFLAASTVYIPHVASAVAAEAMAMREGLGLATRYGYSDVIAESDALEVIEACSGEETWWGASSAIYSDCIDLVALIGRVSFKHCPREANEVAHELARSCFIDKISCNWVDEPPSFILGKLVNDVTIGDV